MGLEPNTCNKRGTTVFFLFTHLSIMNHFWPKQLPHLTGHQATGPTTWTMCCYWFGFFFNLNVSLMINEPQKFPLWNSGFVLSYGESHGVVWANDRTTVGRNRRLLVCETLNCFLILFFLFFLRKKLFFFFSVCLFTKRGSQVSCELTQFRPSLFLFLGVSHLRNQCYCLMRLFILH